MEPVKNVPRVCTTHDFANLRQGGCLYVDKTSFTHKIISNTMNIYFLSRPRMFGKSLFLSTINYILEGREDLFRGLYIYDKYNWALKYTVFHLDFSSLCKESETALKKSFINEFKIIAKTHFNAKLDDDGKENDVCSYFEELIAEAKKVEPTKRLSLLIDEYDAPITEHLHNITKAKEMQTVLRGFFQCLISVQKHFPLVYITGVTKFSKANLFSSLSNVVDLSLSEEFSTVCGFTSQEIETNMMGHLQVAISKKKGVDHKVTRADVNELLNEMALFYDGYHFAPNGRAVFSPSATLAYFREHNHQEFKERTPHVKFVFDILPQYKHSDFPIEGLNISGDYIEMVTELDALKIEQILLDTGIFTIKRYDSYSNTYFLSFPNKKVEQFTIQNLLPKLSKHTHLLKDLSGDTDELVRRLSTLNRENSNKFFEHLRECISKYTYFEDQPKRKKNSLISEEVYISRLEIFYEFHFYVFLALGSTKTPCEIKRQHTIESGRTDLTVAFPNRKIVIFELKVNLKDRIDTTLALSATVQATKYAQKHFAKNDVITCIGLVFNIHSTEMENWIGITYNSQGNRTEFFSNGDLIKEDSIPDLKFS